MNSPECTFDSLMRELELLFVILADHDLAGPTAAHFLIQYEEENGHDVFHRLLELLDACEADLAARARSEKAAHDTKRYDVVIHRAVHWLERHFSDEYKEERKRFPKPDRDRIRAWVRLGLQHMRRSS